jgi:hypothetical protein
MLTQEMLFQIEFLRQEEVTFEEIGRLLNTSAPNVFGYYKLYILPFFKVFSSIVKELKLYDMTMYKKECQDLLYRVLSRLKKYTKFRNVELLAPVVVFAVFRSKGVLIKASEFCRVSHISLSDFKQGLFIVNPICLEYIKRNHEQVVSQMVDKVIVQFNMDDLFRDGAKKLFRKFFPLFKNTKDNIVAALIIALTFVALDYEIQALSEIFEALGTDITRAHYHISRKIFLPNQLGDFKGFVKSKEQLKRFLLTKI